MKNIKLVILAGAFASVAAIAGAQETTPAPQTSGDAGQHAQKVRPRLQARLDRLDANKDGAIDEQEFATAQNLKDADTNGDGTLSTEELAAMIQKRQAERQAQRLLRQLDVDGDGKVTIAEVEQQRAKRFALMDRNNDGKLEAHELRGKGHGKHWRKGKHDRRHFEQPGKGI